ncbi:S41 family peptidase [Niveibacterium umoris]|uniref:C-terminal processing protease CtpA/Prc n=1 Tax=Niveibacterium umoris TaxID=1193620 RepID=A0A840BPS8_9RHOO|nr:S41 family peptidase [Niveibacterium umoris]MBB4013682.1 C-terminal processing protease CtpA/Prc [Niveibacterium umoris]
MTSSSHRTLASIGLITLLAACGGGGGGSSGGAIQNAGFPASSTLAAQCIAPRSGSSPVTGIPYADRAGSAATEKAWLRSWTNELYLWYREVPDPDPTTFSTVLSYFDVLKTTAKTASGKSKDQFHFTYATDKWEAMSQAGVSAGYGAEWAVVSRTPPREIHVGYVQAGTPAERAGLLRGTQILTVDGLDVANSSNVDGLNQGLGPDDPGATHTFTVRDPGASTTRDITMTSEAITMQPVMNTHWMLTPTGTLGYLQFNDHIAPAEAALVSAIEQLRTVGVSDLVLDIRYNGGGYLAIASQLAYMIAGPARTTGATFERQVFNDKYPSTNPVTGRALTPTPFYNTTLGFSLTQGQALPTLGLNRVYVLTGAGTCSASEAIINGLRGVGVEVIQIGNTTCGKPYGFYAQDNCGTTYFSIQFRGVNAAGYGDYADGFVPASSGDAGLPGCVVADDFSHALGDPAEGRFAAALGYRATGTCPVQTAARSTLGNAGGPAISGRAPWRDNRILQR